MDALVDGDSNSGNGRRFGVSGQGQQGARHRKRKGDNTMSERTNQSRNGLSHGINRTLQRGAAIQGGNIQAVNGTTTHPEAYQTVRLFTWQGISETLALLWMLFILSTTRIAGCGHVASTYDVDTTSMAEAPEISALRQAIDSGREELRTAAERFDKAALSVSANKKTTIEPPRFVRDSIGQ